MFDLPILFPTRTQSRSENIFKAAATTASGSPGPNRELEDAPEFVYKLYTKCLHENGAAAERLFAAASPPQNHGKLLGRNWDVCGLVGIL